MVQGFGFNVIFDPAGRIYIKLDPYYTGRIEGLCGDNDGNPNDYVSCDHIPGSKEHFIKSFEGVSCNSHGRLVDDMNPCHMAINVS